MAIEDATRLLQKNFGSKKSSATYERNKKKHVNIDVIKDELDASVYTEKEPDSSNLADMNENSVLRYSSLLPPYNKNAKNIKDAYAFNLLIDAHVLDEIVKHTGWVLESVEESG